MINTTRHKQLRPCKIALATALCAMAFSQMGPAQVPPPSILQIDVANNVLYVEDASDVSKFATNPNVANQASLILATQPTFKEEPTGSRRRRKRTTRAHPMDVYFNRSVFGIKAMLLRLRAQVDVHAVLRQERPH